MNAKHLLATTTIAAAVLAGAGLPTATAAHAAIEPTRWGFVAADQPSNPNYAPNPDFQGNSTGALNTVRRLSVGDYEVTFPGLKTPNSSGTGSDGTAAVTANGATFGGFCNIVSWGSVGEAMKLSVRCYNAAGARADQLFTANFYRDAGSDGWDPSSQPGVMAYTFSNDTLTPINAHGRYHTSFQGLVQSTRLSTGAYSVRIDGFGSYMPQSGGTVMVTSVGSVPNRCKAASWDPSGSAMVVKVLCHRAAALTDSKFTMQFTKGISLTGNQIAARAYAWVSNTASPNPTVTPAYSINVTSNHNSGGAITVIRTAAGEYSVNLPGGQPPLESATHVTAYGSGAAHCMIKNWTSAVGAKVIKVRCFDGTSGGTPTDSPFVVHFGQ